MKKSCGLYALVWLALMGAYAYVAWGKTHGPVPTAAIGFLGGTFAAMLVSSFAGLFTGGTDREALKRAVAGDPPKDGRLEAASGRVRALGTPLEAPFTGRRCVAYEYDVKNPSEGRSDFTGVALTPCVVDAARGPVRILGWSLLDEFPKTLKEEIDGDRALAYLKGASFEHLGLTNAFSFLSGLLADHDGSIRKDMSIGHGPPTLEGRHLSERIVPEGANVTVLGTWSEAERGFKPASSAAMNRLYPVSAGTVLAGAGGGAWKNFGIALFFFLALHAILVPIYFLAPGR